MNAPPFDAETIATIRDLIATVPTTPGVSLAQWVRAAFDSGLFPSHQTSYHFSDAEVKRRYSYVYQKMRKMLRSPREATTAQRRQFVAPSIPAMQIKLHQIVDDLWECYLAPELRPRLLQTYPGLTAFDLRDDCHCYKKTKNKTGLFSTTV